MPHAFGLGKAKSRAARAAISRPSELRKSGFEDFKARISKSETNSKVRATNSKREVFEAPGSLVASIGYDATHLRVPERVSNFGHSIIRVCFEFRYSIFGSASLARIV